MAKVLITRTLWFLFPKGSSKNFRKSIFLSFHLHHLRKNSNFAALKTPFWGIFFRKRVEFSKAENHLRKFFTRQVVENENVAKFQS